MNIRRAWTLYVVLRLLFFAVPFAVLLLIGWAWWLALIVATLVSVSLSVIFLSKPRNTASAGIYEWRTRERTADDIEEDEALASSQGTAEAAQDPDHSGSDLSDPNLSDPESKSNS